MQLQHLLQTVIRALAYDSLTGCDLYMRLASFPGLGGGGERAWFQPFAHALNYLGFNHVLISGKVPMTPSKSHG